MAKYVYPAIFLAAEEGGYCVSFPDLPCTTEGDTIGESIEMAEDALALLLYSYEVDGIEIPEPSKLEDVRPEAAGFASYVVCDTLEYRKHFNNKAVKKTLSIPEWLNEEATAKGINFSAVLQEALKVRLGL